MNDLKEGLYSHPDCKDVNFYIVKIVDKNDVRYNLRVLYIDKKSGALFNSKPDVCFLPIEKAKRWVRVK